MLSFTCKCQETWANTWNDGGLLQNNLQNEIKEDESLVFRVLQIYSFRTRLY